MRGDVWLSHQGAVLVIFSALLLGGEGLEGPAAGSSEACRTGGGTHEVGTETELSPRTGILFAHEACPEVDSLLHRANKGQWLKLRDTWVEKGEPRSRVVDTCRDWAKFDISDVLKHVVFEQTVGTDGSSLTNSSGQLSVLP
eukprot:scaffold2879_cov269-Prasinococcus_capsulatus_cf.AAC.15